MYRSLEKFCVENFHTNFFGRVLIFVVRASHENLSPGSYHRDEYTWILENRLGALVASTFIGRQLLEKYVYN